MKAGAVALFCLSTSAAWAAQQFTVTPGVLHSGITANPGFCTAFPSLCPQTSFAASSIGGTSASLIVRDSVNPDLFTGSGYIQLASFQQPVGTALSSTSTGLTTGYALWLQFNYAGVMKTTPPGLGFGDAGTNYNLTSLTFNVWGQSLFNNNSLSPTPTAVAFAAGNTATAPTVTTTAPSPALGPSYLGPRLIGSGSLLSGEIGITSPTVGGPRTATLTALTNFGLTSFGSTFFTAPVPFYNLSFSSFTNTGGQITSSGTPVDRIHVTGVGNLDFLGRTVPTPSTLALLGIALVGLGVAGRMRRTERKV
jgi:hypothetical protein